MQALADLGGETWFRLGDGDLALHVERTRRLGDGEPWSRIAEDLAHRLGVHARVVPACDAALRTVVRTRDGRMAFQHYFVRDRCEPMVTGFDFEGAENARPCDAVLEALSERSLRCVVVCPSNPFISIDPILAMPGMSDAIRAAAAPVIGVSPIVGGRAVKGPTAKMMRELGLEVSNRAIERHYGDIVGRLGHRLGGCEGCGRIRSSGACRPDSDAHRRGQGCPRAGGAGVRGRALTGGTIPAPSVAAGQAERTEVPSGGRTAARRIIPGRIRAACRPRSAAAPRRDNAGSSR